MCDTEAAKEAAIKDGITAFTLSEYVRGIASKPELADKLALFDEKSQEAKVRFLF